MILHRSSGGRKQKREGEERQIYKEHGREKHNKERKQIVGMEGEIREEAQETEARRNERGCVTQQQTHTQGLCPALPRFTLVLSVSTGESSDLFNRDI